jgi:Rrf2 family transcriptional regulator, nitric oxide-sensitive transcriptional repressor
MMLTRTSLSAIRTLIYLGLNQDLGPISPRRIATALGESPTYLAKVTSQLVKAGILRAHRGVLGGVTLARDPQTITLLAVVQACQGQFVGSFCTDVPDTTHSCAFHRAGLELHQAVVRVLSKWTLADLLQKPLPSVPIPGIDCLMTIGGVVG